MSQFPCDDDPEIRESFRLLEEGKERLLKLAAKWRELGDPEIAESIEHGVAVGRADLESFKRKVYGIKDN